MSIEVHVICKGFSLVCCDRTSLEIALAVIRNNEWAHLDRTPDTLEIEKGPFRVDPPEDLETRVSRARVRAKPQGQIRVKADSAIPHTLEPATYSQYSQVMDALHAPNTLKLIGRLISVKRPVSAESLQKFMGDKRGLANAMSQASRVCNKLGDRCALNVEDFFSQSVHKETGAKHVGLTAGFREYLMRAMRIESEIQAKSAGADLNAISQP